MELFFILLCHICHLQSSCCRHLFTFIPLYHPINCVIRERLLCLHILKSTDCVSAIPHLPHTYIPLLQSTHSPFETEYHYNFVCFVVLGCIILFPLMTIFTFLLVNCCVRNTPTVDCCIRTTYSHTPRNITSSTTTSFISSNIPFDCCVLHWKRAN